MLGQDLFKSVPEGLRGEAFRRDTPERMQNRSVIPISHLSLGPRLTDAVDGCQQKVASRRRAGARCRPERLQHAQQTGLFGGEPESAGQSKVARRGGQRDRGGAVLDQGSDLLGSTEICLVDDAGLAINAGAFDDVVVELLAFLLGDERGHIG